MEVLELLIEDYTARHKPLPTPRTIKKIRLHCCLTEKISVIFKAAMRSCVYFSFDLGQNLSLPAITPKTT